MCNGQAAQEQPEQPHEGAATSTRLAWLEARLETEMATLRAQIDVLKRRDLAREEMARFMRGDTGGFAAVRPHLEVLPGAGEGNPGGWEEPAKPPCSDRFRGLRLVEGKEPPPLSRRGTGQIPAGSAGGSPSPPAQPVASQQERAAREP